MTNRPRREKRRLDEFLVSQGFVSSLQKAQSLILQGHVLVNEEPVLKAGTPISGDVVIRLRNQPTQFVSRGGEKINAALDHFKISLEGIVTIDVGSSTGGFTDCMLQKGACLVYAVDVGRNQLDFRLRQDARVVVMEETHAKNLQGKDFDPLPSFAALDLSFISLRLVLQPVVQVLESPFHMLALVKPQFELSREYVEKGGVVPDLEHQLQAVKLVVDYATSIGLSVVGSFPSPIKGQKKGNQEHFVYLKSKEVR